MATNFKRGDKVVFPRGMFGDWNGTIRQLYMARPRGTISTMRNYGDMMAEISYTRANGKFGRTRVNVKLLKLVEDRIRELVQKTEPLARDERNELCRLQGVKLATPAVEARAVAIVEKLLKEES